jgi:Leucine-rich repeat (LRR) protein
MQFNINVIIVCIIIGQMLCNAAEQTTTNAMWANANEPDCNQFMNDFEIVRSLPFHTPLDPITTSRRTYALMNTNKAIVDTLCIYNESYVPPNIFCLKNLVTLTIDGTPFHYINGNLDYQTGVVPDSLRNFKLLQTLNIRNTQINKMTDYFGNLTSLRMLNIENSEIHKMTDHFGNLTGLTVLNIRNSKIHKMTDHLGSLTGLTSLVLINCSVTSLPNLGKLTGLTSLSTVSNPLTSLVGLYRVTTLELSNCQFSNIPAMAIPTALTSLYMQNNQLSYVDNLDLYKSLRSANFDGNRIKQLQPSIGQLTSLTVLSLSNNELSELPIGIIKLPNLAALNIANNRFSPSELQATKNAYKQYHNKPNHILTT